jgi:hypothetical protein
VAIILSVPHGGSLEPESIPDRSEKLGHKITTITDLHTIEVAEIASEAIEEALGNGMRPHMIVSNLRRWVQNIIKVLSKFLPCLLFAFGRQQSCLPKA